MTIFELKQQLIVESSFIEEFVVTFDRCAGWFCSILILYSEGSYKIEMWGETEEIALQKSINEYQKFIS